MAENKCDVIETIYDLDVQDQFENWLIESGIKVRFNTATYFIEMRKRNNLYSFLRKIGLNVKDEITTLHIVTNRPGWLISINGSLINKYKEIFAGQGIDNVIIHEVRDQDVLLRGIKRKIKD